MTITFAQEQEETERLRSVARGNSADAALDIIKALVRQRPSDKEATAEFAYERIRASEFYYSLTNNDAIDAKADELASVIEDTVAHWFTIQEAIGKTEHIDLFPLESTPIRSLLEAQVDRSAR